jgi:glycosyltransferase involved in cell wall biosynthesis
MPVLQKYLNLLKGFFNILPFQVNYFFNRKHKIEIEKLLVRFNPDILFCQLIRMSEYAKDMEVAKVLDYMDAFSKGIQRRLEEQPFYLKKIFELEYKRLLHYEAEIHKYFDASIIISNADKEVIPFQNEDNIATIRNGVNFEYFKPKPGIVKEYDLAFTGNMSYPPNVSAVLYLYHEILPIIRQKLPEIKVLIAGANPISKIKELHSVNFVVTGWVENINEYYAKSRIFIAPMLIGTGLQNKLLEAMAVELPCITSPLVNLSLGAKENKEILIADSPTEFADYVVQLLENPDFANEVAKAGYRFVRQNFSWGSTTDQLNDIFQQVKLKVQQQGHHTLN